MQLHFYPEGTSPIDVAEELGYDKIMPMLVWVGDAYRLIQLWYADNWRDHSYSGSHYPGGYGTDFAKHWRFAVLDQPPE